MKRRGTVVFAILTALLLCFIWGQSMLPRDRSAGESRLVMRYIKPLLDPKDRIDSDLFHHLLRKTAHFTEYAALGLSVSGLRFSLRWKKIGKCALAALAFCVLAAAMDETIQLFAADRGPQLRDVLLDTCGALFGIAAYVLPIIFRRQATGTK